MLNCLKHLLTAKTFLQIMSQIVQARLASASGLKEDPEKPLNFMSLATQTEGYSATDLKDLVTRALHQAAIRADRGPVIKDGTVRPLDFL